MAFTNPQQDGARAHGAEAHLSQTPITPGYTPGCTSEAPNMLGRATLLTLQPRSGEPPQCVTGMPADRRTHSGPAHPHSRGLVEVSATCPTHWTPQTPRRLHSLRLEQDSTTVTAAINNGSSSAIYNHSAL